MQDDCIDNALYGVVLVVYCRTSKRFLFLRELKDMPQTFKTKGMLAFPSETRESYDSSVRATIARLLDEEVGMKLSGDILLSLEPLSDFRHKIPVYISWVVVDDEFCAVPNDTDVEHGAWLDESDICTLSVPSGYFRIETMPVLKKVLLLAKSALI